MVIAFSLVQSSCVLKHPDLLRQEAVERKRTAQTPDAICWQRAEGFRTTRAGYYAMAPEPEAVAYAGPLNLIILPGLGLATLVMGIFTIPFDLVALPIRCTSNRGGAETSPEQ